MYETYVLHAQYIYIFKENVFHPKIQQAMLYAFRDARAHAYVCMYVACEQCSIEWMNERMHEWMDEWVYVRGEKKNNNTNTHIINKEKVL